MADARARPPLLRYPFLWAFLVGIIALTLVRPCLRRIPEPPPVTGRFPEATLVDADGGPFDRDRMAGAVWVVAFLAEDCGEPCDLARRHLVELDETYAALRVGGIRMVRVAASDTPPPGGGAEPAAGPPRRVLALGPPEVVRDLGAAVCGAWPPPSPGCLAIVDTAGNLRGHYAADTDGFNEVYNRARHVRDAPAPVPAPAADGAAGPR